MARTDQELSQALQSAYDHRASYGTGPTGPRAIYELGRADEVADERQRFLDEAAMRLYACTRDRLDNFDPQFAYSWAESLWEERERRRRGKP
ncbi:MAG TPA: hypothetical protein VGK73_25175 [Polyangiaceae bacterium]